VSRASTPQCFTDSAEGATDGVSIDRIDAGQFFKVVLGEAPSFPLAPITVVNWQTTRRFLTARGGYGTL
jgi:hypothetical protein